MTPRTTALLRPLVLGALVPLALLAGCGSDDSPSTSASSGESSTPSPSESESAPEASESASESASPGAEAAAAPCESLDAKDLRALTGKDLGAGNAGQVGTLPACQWGSPTSAGVQAVSVTAQEWGAELPGLIQQVKASGAFDDAANTQQLEKASKLVEQGKQLDADQACNLFSELAELQGNKPGQDTTVTLLPTSDNPQAISAQTCTDGRFASVLVIKPGITGSRKEIGTVSDALERVVDAS
jgi:hypothetical protein